MPLNDWPDGSYQIPDSGNTTERDLENTRITDGKPQVGCAICKRIVNLRLYRFGRKSEWNFKLNRELENPFYREFLLCATDYNLIVKLRKEFPEENAIRPQGHADDIIIKAILFRDANPINEKKNHHLSEAKKLELRRKELERKRLQERFGG